VGVQRRGPMWPPRSSSHAGPPVQVGRFRRLRSGLSRGGERRPGRPRRGRRALAADGAGIPRRPAVRRGQSPPRELAGSGAEHVAPRPLGAEVMREIRAVRGRAAAPAPVGRLLEASGGLSRRIHEDVAGHAGRRSSVSGVRAGGTAARRGELHELEGGAGRERGGAPRGALEGRAPSATPRRVEPSGSDEGGTPGPSVQILFGLGLLYWRPDVVASPAMGLIGGGRRAPRAPSRGRGRAAGCFPRARRPGCRAPPRRERGEGCACAEGGPSGGCSG
jgi:hypothetical protein